VIAPDFKHENPYMQLLQIRATRCFPTTTLESTAWYTRRDGAAVAYREWHLAAPLPLSSMRVKVLMQHGCSNQAMYMATYFLIQLGYSLLDPLWQSVLINCDHAGESNENFRNIPPIRGILIGPMLYIWKA